jgi:hypothetical protein
MSNEIDAIDVLSSYSTLLGQRDRPVVVRDIGELKHPKQVIKLVLMHCIKLAEEGQERAFLKAAYISLADFQAISIAERMALDIWLQNVSAADPNGMSDSSSASSLSSTGALALAVHKRVVSEAENLQKELIAEGL